jgi:hypothetical protein
VIFRINGKLYSWKIEDNLAVFTEETLNFSQFKSRGLYEKNSVGIWNLQTEDDQGNLCQEGRSLDLPDAH